MCSSSNAFSFLKNLCKNSNLDGSNSVELKLSDFKFELIVLFFEVNVFDVLLMFLLLLLYFLSIYI